ncbi:MAG: penicillin-binding transpeptidase domain-containing protein, partial [Bacillota bacterium]
KIIVAAAALEKGTVTEESKFICNGYEEINGIRINCSKEEGHGEITFRDAFAKSCNAAFIQLGAQTGGEEILEMAKAFGVGKKAFQNKMEEKIGTLPGTDEIQGAGIGNLSIGQGKVLITPAQAARITAIIAAGGIDNGLSIIKGTTEGGKTSDIKKDEPARIISRETSELIKEMMVDTVNYGTANNLSGAGV